jgi:hypothetical protein
MVLLGQQDHQKLSENEKNILLLLLTLVDSPKAAYEREMYCISREGKLSQSPPDPLWRYSVKHRDEEM